jgi:hypothetical protein
MHRYLPLGIIVALLILFRMVGVAFPEALPNFQPLMAVFFCGALLSTGWRGFAIPLGIWAITYPFGIGPIYDLPIFITTLMAFVVTFFLGKMWSKKPLPLFLVGSVLASVTFHFITSSAAWIGDPLYAKTLTGFWQSFWVGPPISSIPSWVFLRNLCAANFLFTALVLLATFRRSEHSFVSALSKRPSFQ